MENVIGSVRERIRARGLAQGREEGREEGRMEGRMEERACNILNLIKMGKFPLEDIAQGFGMTLDEVRALAVKHEIGIP